ncbi:MAG: protein kinase [Myxococcota bacterium]|nr:protein kinase [Myxococcota bacterium]
MTERVLGKGRFLVQREIGRGAMGVVYEAIEQESNLRVALKTLLRVNADQIYRLKTEFRSLQDLAHPNLCHLIELVEEEGIWFIVMELIEGLDFFSYSTGSSQRRDPLSSLVSLSPRHSALPPGPGFVSQWCGVDEDRLRRAMRGVTHGLSALHAAGKVHRDIKPTNVLVTRSGRAALLDFGLVLDPQERSSDILSLSGTLEYMAPEMAGATEVGPEADWYSVGVMLYEALTGTLPYSGDAKQIFIEKQYKDPTPIDDPAGELPRELKELCMALLRLDPRERPAIGEILGRLGLRFSSGPPMLPPSLSTVSTEQVPLFVGRQEELDTLDRAFGDTLSGRAVSVVVEGVSGVGKSALCQQFIQQVSLAHPNTIVLSGRCYERESVPFKAFDGVVDALVTHLLSLPEEEVEPLVPPNVALLARLFPTLNRVGAIAKAPGLRQEIVDPHEMQRRAFRAMRDMLVALTQRHPLIVLIDDMQWTDSDSLLLFDALLRAQEALPMLLILLSRFADFGGNSVLNWGTALPGDLRRLGLHALSREISHQLVRLCLKQAGLDPEDRDASEIVEEAQGHPMYITELVHQASSGKEGENGHNLRLEDAIWSRLQRFPPAARCLLEFCCVAGVPLKEEFLRKVSELSKAEFVESVAQLRTAKLLSSGGVGKEAPMEPYHGRVREAVMVHLAQQGRAPGLHLEIGRLLLDRYKKEKIDENIFEVVWHLNAGQAQMEDPAERYGLLLLNFQAGKQARAAAAYAAAVDHFEKSLALFPSDAWEKHYQDTLALYVSAAEAAYLKGDFARTRSLVREALQQVSATLDRAQLFEVLIVSLSVEGKPFEAMDQAIEIIHELGVKLRKNPPKIHILSKIVRTNWLLKGKTREDILAFPDASDPRIIAAKRLMAIIGASAYLYNPQLWAVLILDITIFSARYGKDPLSSVAFACWGVINSSLLKKYQYGFEMGKLALEMLELFDDQSKRAMILYVWTVFVQHWRVPLCDTLPSILESHEAAVEVGDLIYLGVSASSYCNHAFFAGKELGRLLNECEFYTESQEQANQTSSLYRNRLYQQAVSNLLGHAEDPSRIFGEFFNEDELVPLLAKRGEKMSLFHYFLYCSILQHLFGHYREAAESARQAMAFRRYVVGTYLAAVFPFYDSLVHLALCQKEGERPCLAIRWRIAKNQRFLKKLACHCPANHLHKYQLIEAERERRKGKTKAAAALYDKAIDSALEHGFIQYAALACELAALFYRSTNDASSARKYMLDAHRHYAKWGASAKLRHLEESFSELLAK